MMRFISSILLSTLVFLPGALLGYGALDWSDPVPLTEGPEYDVLPLALDDLQGGIWVLWMRTDPSSPMEHPIMASHYDGVDWSTPEVVTPDSLVMINAFEVDRPFGATMDGLGNLCVVWYYGDYPVAGSREAPWGLYERTRAPEGWLEPELIFDCTVITPVLSLDLTTAADGDLVLAFCAQEQDQQGLWVVESIYMTERADTGWSFIYPIAEGYGNASMLNVFHTPRIAPDDSGGVWLTYSEDYQELSFIQEKKVWVCYFKDGNPSAQEMISGEAAQDARSDIGVHSSGEVLVVWTRGVGTFDIYHSQRIGESWHGPWPVVEGTSNFEMPRLSCDERGITWLVHSKTTERESASIWSRRKEELHGAGDWVFFKEQLFTDSVGWNIRPIVTPVGLGPVFSFWEHSEGDNSDLYYSHAELTCGDAWGDGSVTPADAYYLLNHLGGGPYPVSYWSCNTNGDLDITPADAYVTLNFLGSAATLECHYVE